LSKFSFKKLKNIGLTILSILLSEAGKYVISSGSSDAYPQSPPL